MRFRWRGICGVLLAAFWLALAPARPAGALSCVQQTGAEMLARADLVFWGEVTGSAPAFGQGTRWAFRVHQYLKGSDGETLEIFQPAGDEMWLTFAAGERWLVFARQVEGELQAQLCSGTMRLDPLTAERLEQANLADLVPHLTSPAPGAHAGSESGPPRTAGLLLLFGAAGLGLLAAVGLILASRRRHHQG